MMASFWRDRNVFITGGTGDIGSALSKLLIGLGSNVTVLSRNPQRATSLKQAGAHLVKGDVRDQSTLEIPEKSTVVHGAAWVAYGIPKAKKALFRETNVEGTKNVLQAAKDANADRFCHISSCAAIGPTPAGLYAEDRAVERRFPTYQSLYAETKHRSHVHVLDNHEPLRTTLVMPSVVTGLGTWTEPLMQRFADGLRFGIKGDTPTGFVHLDDVIEGTLAAIEHGQGPYVLNDKNLTLTELFTLFQEASGTPAPTRRIPIGLVKRLARIIQTPYLLRGKVPPISTELVRSLEKPHMYSAARAHQDIGFKPNMDAHLARDFDRLTA